MEELRNLKNIESGTTEQTKSEEIWELIKFALISALIVVPIRLWVAQPFIVYGASMEPTFHNGDYLIIDEVSYQFRKPQKGEVVVFKYPLNPSKYFIKRIANTPGDDVSIEKIKIDTLGDNEYFVLGDNTNHSSDSRVWGSVNEELIVGRALVRLWPINKIELLPGDK